MTSLTRSALYTGQVWHKRFTVKRHAFRYPIFYVLLDLDAFDGNLSVPNGLKLDRHGLCSLWQKHYGGGTETGLKNHIISLVRSAGASVPPHKIMLLTMPRIVGYTFNPISIFYCYDHERNLNAVVYEVHNTFGEKHSYIHLLADANLAPHTAPKELHVSPFFPVSGRYEFRHRPLDETLAILITYFSDNGAKQLSASLTGKRIDLTSRNLRRLLIGVPFVTLKVSFAIHFQALRLWLRGVSVHPKPQPPSTRLTAAHSSSRQSTGG
ncbi:DUF1365 domain-containing protein [Kordiimonas sp.]|uniref:DUF1365 domain-containing protein n=1 Tax=Kordiimonas sp. TaxID=1970157 RepID=UPI003A91E715